MQLRTTFTIGFAVLAQPIHAQVDCDLVNAMTRVSETTQTHATWNNGGPLPNAVQSDLSRFSASSIQHLFQDVPSTSAISTLSEFAVLTSQIAQLARDGRGADIHIFLNSPRVRATFEDAGKVLDSIGCNGPLLATKTSTPSQQSSPGSASPDTPPAVASGSSFAMSLSYFWYIFAAVAAAGLGAATWFYFRIKETRRRRRRRYSTNQYVKFQVGPKTCSGRMLDISCNGLKLRHLGAISANQQETLRVEIDRRFYETRIQWCNEHYVGLAFMQPLRTASVLQILVSGRSQSGPSQDGQDVKTAPEGAPQS